MTRVATGRALPAMNRRLWSALLLAIAVLFGATTARADPPAAQLARSRARALGLARTTAWRRLVLYRPVAGGRSSSQVDSAEFFLAFDGKHDPAAELEATVDAFFVPLVPGAEDTHALCTVPGAPRLARVDAPLHGRPPPTADMPCARSLRGGDGRRVRVVRLRVELRRQPGLGVRPHAPPRQEEGHPRARLAPRRSRPEVDRRDHGIDYTAVVDTKNPFLYAFKGLAGLFPGTLRFRTYDAMLRDYGGYEARDLWEYELALTREELNLLVLHLWELAHSTIDYWYLTENCSYHILAALDAAAPRLRLVDHVKLDVMPLDTVKAVSDSPGLVRSVVYRPSMRSAFRASLAKLDAHERDTVEALLERVDAPLPADLSPTRAALVLDTARLALDARFAASIVDGKNQAALRARKHLVERRKGITSAPFVPTMTTAPRDKEPHRGHGSMRALLGTGMTTQYGTGFATFGYRLALHDLVDPPDGEPELLQLQFLDTRMRYDYGRQKLTLDTLTFADLVTLNPLRSFEQKLSWRVRAFGTRLHDRAAPDAFAHGLDAAVGAALASGGRSRRRLSHGRRLRRLLGSGRRHRRQLRTRGRGAARRPPRAASRGRVGVVTGTMSYLPAQSLDITFDLRASLRARLASQVAMGLEGAAQPRAFELQLGSYLYF